jgi:hypothetical protein
MQPNITTYHRLEQKKAKFYKFLGCQNNEQLIQEVLKNGLAGDKFKQNNENILKNFFDEHPDSDNFIRDFYNWTNLKYRKSASTCSKTGFFKFLCLLVAVILLQSSLLIPSCFIPGILLGTISPVFCLIAEGVAKRNIANIENLEENLGNKIEASTSKMIEEIKRNPSIFNEETKSFLSKLKKPNDYKYFKKLLNNGLSSLSFFGILAIGIVHICFPLIAGNSGFLIFSVFTAIIPIAKVFAMEARFESQNVENRYRNFDKTVSKIYSTGSYNNRISAFEIFNKIDHINDVFKTHMENSDCNGKVIGEYGFKKDENSDNLLNPAKFTTFNTWLSAKVHRVINDKLQIFDNKDLADYIEPTSFPPLAIPQPVIDYSVIASQPTGLRRFMPWRLLRVNGPVQSFSLRRDDNVIEGIPIVSPLPTAPSQRLMNNNRSQEVNRLNL